MSHFAQGISKVITRTDVIDNDGDDNKYMMVMMMMMMISK